MVPLCAKSLRALSSETTLSCSRSDICVFVSACHSSESPISSTLTSPRYCWQSARYIHSFFVCSVRVRSARTIFVMILYELSSDISPEGRSMLMTMLLELFIYLTREANPPPRGLLSPEPKRASMTIVSGESSGGSNSSFTSTKRFMLRESRRRARLVWHSSLSRPVTLKR